jgi:hypothetical protein
MNVYSSGNANATNITYNCTWGEVCDNFTVVYYPENISLLEPGNGQAVNVSITVPPLYEAGEYAGIITAYEESGSNDSVFVVVTVPINLSWQQTPSSITVNLSHDTNGTIGYITVQNIGNARIVLEVVQSGNGTPYIPLDKDELTLNIGQSDTIMVNYTMPYTDSVRTYTSLIRTENLTADPSYKDTLVTVNLFPFSFDIINPTSTNPIKNVSENDTVQITVNVTYAGLPLNHSIEFNLTLFNTTGSWPVTITSANYSNYTGLWHLNFTAPNLAPAIGYDLNASALYVNASIWLYDVELKAVIYRDTIPPGVAIEVPPRVPANSTADIYINATDAGGVEKASMTITFPDNSTMDFNATFVEKIGDLYRFVVAMNYTTQVGIYYANASAWDFSGNWNYSETSFEIFPGVIWAGESVNMEKVHRPPFHLNFTFYLAGTSYKAYNFSTNGSGGYYELLDMRAYDINITFRNESIMMYDSDLVYDVYNPVLFGKIPGIKMPSAALKGYYIYTTPVNYSYAGMTFDCGECYIEGECELSDFTLSNLGIYRCDNWAPMEGCQGSWSSIDSTVNSTHYSISANTTSLNGAFVLAEWLCGDGACESGKGESNAVCPSDCPITIPDIDVGGGGGGGGGGGAQAVTVSGPIEVKTTFIYVTLSQGEYEIHSMEIINNRAGAITANFTVDGLIWDLVQIEKPSITISGRSVGVSKIKIYTLPTTQPGTYTGDIITNIPSLNLTHRTPVTIKVERVPVPLLDVQLKSLTKTVSPGENFKFEVTLLNMGETATIDDIVVQYTIKNLNTEDVLTIFTETVAVEQSLTFRRNITIPLDTPYDRYVIEANVTYWHGTRYAFAADAFDVAEIPPILVALRAIFMNWVSYVILFLVIPAVYGGRYGYRYLKLKKKKKARYIFPMDFKTLPQAGPNSFVVGKIAETDMLAYLDFAQLQTHGISAGSTGAGKTVSSMIVVEEMLKRNIPVIIFDPTCQWTGFLRPSRDQRMLKLYPRFGLKPEDARRYKGRVIRITDPGTTIDVRNYMKPGEITVILIDKMEPAQLDTFVRKTIADMFKIPWPESTKLKLFIVYDEVHRLLPKYGGKGGYVALERGCREFRKWGIGLWLISQVLMDFKGAIRANISTEIQMRTKYTGDIRRVSQKYGFQYSSTITKLKTGTGMVQNAEYNHGKPYFIEFRPLLHDTGRLSDNEIDEYIKYDTDVEALIQKSKELKARGIDTTDIEFELKLARDKISQTMFTMAKTYIDSVRNRIRKLGG